MKKFWTTLSTLLVVALIVSMSVYSWNNPTLTHMQVFQTFFLPWLGILSLATVVGYFYRDDK
jgi:hypothetical protein